MQSSPFQQPDVEVCVSLSPDAPGQPRQMVPLSTVAPWGDIEVTHRRPGPWACSWEISLPGRPGTRRWPRMLVEKAWVEVYSDTRRTWSGVLDQPDRNSGLLRAVGIARLGEGVQPFNGSGAITSIPNVLLDAGIARGALPWHRGGDFGDTPIGGPDGGTGVEDPDPGSTQDVLNAVSIQSSGANSHDHQWYVTPEGLLSARVEDENSVDWLILPGAEELGVASDDRTDVVCLRYLSSASGVARTARYPATSPPGPIERKASIVHLGPMSPTDALDRAEGMWRACLAGRTGWTNGLLLRPGMVTSLGGQRADLSRILPGDAVRVMDQPDPRYGRSGDIQLVLDETIWRPGRMEKQINPAGLAARTWEQVMEDAMATPD